MPKFGNMALTYIKEMQTQCMNKTASHHSVELEELVSTEECLYQRNMPTALKFSRIFWTATVLVIITRFLITKREKMKKDTLIKEIRIIAIMSFSLMNSCVKKSEKK